MIIQPKPPYAKNQFATSDAAATRGNPLDLDLRGYLARNADIVTSITKPVSLEDVGAQRSSAVIT